MRTVNGRESCFTGEPGVCDLTGEVILSPEEMAVDLELAHNPPDPSKWSGRRSTPEELEELSKGADALFAQMTTDQQVYYLIAVTASEAAEKFARNEPGLRERLWEAIPDDRREAITSHWRGGNRVTLSA